MKTLGLIGGMSWESTELYYRKINEKIKFTPGGLHSAKMVIYSVDFHEIEHLQAQGDWDRAGEIPGEAAKSLKKAGADIIVVCTNTMHKVANTIEKAGGLPLLHIADATAKSIQQQKISRIGLPGTRFTMEQKFYRGRLEEKGISVLIPDKADIDIVHRIIYQELCLGKIHNSSRQEYCRIVDSLQQQGAQGVILGCTEITLLIGADDVNIPVFDTTSIHAEAAALFSLS